MFYSKSNISLVESKLSDLTSKYYDLQMLLYSFIGNMKNQKAIEYLRHGVLRRLIIVYRSINNIFTLFPLKSETRLDNDILNDLEINLHSFLINIYGIIENYGLSLAFEIGYLDSNKVDVRKRNSVCLFKKDFNNYLNNELRSYLRNAEILSWYDEYAKYYRDALAHRIPPYIPPASLNDIEQEQFNEYDKQLTGASKRNDLKCYSEILNKMSKIGSPNFLFVHSFSENVRPVHLHSQVICDFLTIDDLSRNIFQLFEGSKYGI